MTELQTQEAAYMYQDMGSPLEQAISVMGDSIFVCPTYYLLQAFLGRSFKAIFAIPPGLHGEDVAYYFDNVPPPYNNTQFITAFTQAFMAFAMYSNVNIKYDPIISRLTGMNTSSAKQKCFSTAQMRICRSYNL
ncbi:hypothetical protein J3R82DRAFT_11772 [Butyriboletus roseoflavus]|nr:hypothetical protein J3R82DRAFT_11772 [Butyriboletus roseoflavus]